MPYSFKISFPSNPIVTLCAATKTEADNMERALITLQADYVIVGPNSIGGSFQMTPVAHQVLDRLAPRQRSGPHSVMVTLKGIITGLKTPEGQRRGSVSAKNQLRRLPDPPLYSHRKMSIVRKAVHVLWRARPFAVFLQWLRSPDPAGDREMRWYGKNRRRV
jgi:hypothetical protein